MTEISTGRVRLGVWSGYGYERRTNRKNQSWGRMGMEKGANWKGERRGMTQGSAEMIRVRV